MSKDEFTMRKRVERIQALRQVAGEVPAETVGTNDFLARAAQSYSAPGAAEAARRKAKMLERIE